MRYRLLFLALLLSGSCCWGKTYLVSVGISDYPGTASDLRLCDKDAETISYVYGQSCGATTCQLLNQQATASHILNAIRGTLGQAGEEDIVVFFFSGHGYPGGIQAYDRKVSYAEIRAAMAQSKSKNKMIFADTCFSGKMRTKGSAKESQSNVLLFLSSRSNEYSIERKGMENGIFTTWLQRGLRGGADANKNRVITAKELFDFVAPGVASTTKNQQHPVMWGNFSNEMPVIIWKQ